MATAIMSSISVKPADAPRERVKTDASRERALNGEARTAGARDASGRSRLLHVKQNRLDEFRRCVLTSVPPDKCLESRNSEKHLFFHAVRRCKVQSSRLPTQGM